MKKYPQLTLLSLVGFLACCRPSQVEPTAHDARTTSPGGTAGQSTAALLRLAFAAASAFPIDPHARNRGRAQEVVVNACFELGEPVLAATFAEQIGDWRRGVAFANHAFHCASTGDVAGATSYIDKAKLVQKELHGDASAQQWRADLIALKVARVHAAMGDHEAAGAATASIAAESTHAVDPDWTATVAHRVQMLRPELAMAEVQAIDSAFLGMSLGQQHVALATLTGMHARFYGDEPVRESIVDRLTRRYQKLPVDIRLDALAKLVRTTASRGDKAAAASLQREMQAIYDGHSWPLRTAIPEQARLAELRHLAGDTSRARADLDAVLATYHQERDGLLDIERAETLRPVALAFAAVGATEMAMDLLTLVLEEALENPNSRPRCDDFVDTCVAMATAGIEPTEAMWQRMRQIQAGLGNPW